MAEERHNWFMTRVSCHRSALRGYLTTLISRAQGVEELVQETFVRAYSLSDYDSVDSPRDLLLRIGHNLVLELEHREKTQASEGVTNLEPLCRRVFVLRKVFNLSHAEISEVLNVSQSVIEKHVVRGLIRSRDYLRELGFLEAIVPRIKPGAVRRLRDGGDGE